MTDTVWTVGRDTFHILIPGHLVQDERTGDKGEVVGYGDEWVTVRWDADGEEETFRGEVQLGYLVLLGIR